MNFFITINKMSEKSENLNRFIELCDNLKSAVAKMTDQTAELRTIRLDALTMSQQARDTKEKMISIVTDIYYDREVIDDKMKRTINDVKKCQSLHDQLNVEETKNSEYTKHYQKECDEIKEELLHIIDTIFVWYDEDECIENCYSDSDIA